MAIKTDEEKRNGELQEQIIQAEEENSEEKAEEENSEEKKDEKKEN